MDHSVQKNKQTNKTKPMVTIHSEDLKMHVMMFFASQIYTTEQKS